MKRRIFIVKTVYGEEGESEQRANWTKQICRSDSTGLFRKRNTTSMKTNWNTLVVTSSRTGPSQAYLFENYKEGEVVELADDSFALCESDFSFLVWMELNRYDYAMIASKDRACDASQQLRLEIHQSGRVCLMGLGTKEMPHGAVSLDPNGYGSNFVSSKPIPIGKRTHLALVRKDCQLTLYIDGEISCRVSTRRVENHTDLNRRFRVGSRFPPHSGTAPFNPFPGKLTNAMLVLGALEEIDLKKAFAEELPTAISSERVFVTLCGVPQSQLAQNQQFLIDLTSADTWEHIGHLLKLVHGEISMFVPKLFKEGLLSAPKPWKSVSDRVIPPPIDTSKDFTILYNNGSHLSGSLWRTTHVSCIPQ